MSLHLEQVRSRLFRATLSTIGSLTLLEVSTHLPSEGRSSALYHTLFDHVLTPLGRRWLSPEDAHGLALEVVRRGWAPRGKSLTVTNRVKMQVELGNEEQRKLKCESPIGLAAGFDKNGVAISGLFELGFSFVEIGSVTPLPQPGNAKPRSFRLIEDRAVINRFGFNSEGADSVRQHLIEYRNKFGGKGAIIQKNEEFPCIPELHNAGTEENQISEDGGESDYSEKRRNIEDEHDDFKEISFSVLNSARSTFRTTVSWVWHRIMNTQPKTGILGVNLGKNKESNDEIGDYITGICKLGPYADYLVINVSSPNTPGLRSLQQREPLEVLLRATLKARDEFAPHAPLFVKLAPDLSDEEMKDVAQVIIDTGIDGMIVSNTTSTRPENLLSKNKYEIGGLSGAPIRERSTECIRTMYRLTNGSIPIIGVGGVGSGRDAYEKLKAGASLIQVYSMMVYEGPGLIDRIRRDLSAIIEENGHRNVEEVIGIDCEEIYWAKREERLNRKMLNVEKIVVDL